MNCTTDIKYFTTESCNYVDLYVMLQNVQWMQITYIVVFLLEVMCKYRYTRLALLVSLENYSGRVYNDLLVCFDDRQSCR